jgi:hypothetical protein
LRNRFITSTRFNEPLEEPIPGNKANTWLRRKRGAILGENLDLASTRLRSMSLLESKVLRAIRASQSTALTLMTSLAHSPSGTGCADSFPRKSSFPSGLTNAAGVLPAPKKSKFVSYNRNQRSKLRQEYLSIVFPRCSHI